MAFFEGLSASDDQCYYAVVIFHVNNDDAAAADASVFKRVLLPYLPVSLIGCEMMLITPLTSPTPPHATRTIAQQELDSMVYYSDPGAVFSSVNVGKRAYRETTHRAFSIKISADEHHQLQMYLLGLCNRKLPYCTASVPLMAVPRALHSSLCTDVEHESTQDFSALTSTQAVLFALRNCLDTDRSVSSTLRAVNSRFAAPHTLHAAIELYARPANVMSLNIARVQHVVR